MEFEKLMFSYVTVGFSQIWSQTVKVLCLYVSKLFRHNATRIKTIDLASVVENI